MGGAEWWGDFGRFWLVNFFGWPRTYNSVPFSLRASITYSGGSRIEGSLWGRALLLRTTLSQDWSETGDGKTVVMLSTLPIYHTKLDFFSLYSIARLAIYRAEKNQTNERFLRNATIIIPCPRSSKITNCIRICVISF